MGRISAISGCSLKCSVRTQSTYQGTSPPLKIVVKNRKKEN